MTSLDSYYWPRSPAVITPEDQSAVWFLGSRVQVRLSSTTTAGQLAVLEHHGERGYGSPLHSHRADEETFVVLEGELRFEVDGEISHAGPGSVAFLPRRLAHAFVVTSAEARFLTLHTPAGFDEFTVAAGTAAGSSASTPPAVLVDPDPAALSELAAAYGIDIIGPAPRP